MAQYRRPKATLQLTGIKELDRKLKRLADREAKKIVRSAMASAARVGAKSLKDELPIGTSKKLKKSVGSSYKKDSKYGMTVAKWGVNIGKKGKNVAIAAPVLSGTKSRRTKSGHETGAIRGDDAVARAEAKSRPAVILKIAEMVRAGLAKLGR